ncbi:MAG TPA: C45 family peptidase [Bacteroidales bacterium]
MKKIFLFLFIGVVFFSCENSQNKVERIGNLTIVHLKGNPYQIGYDYGKLLKPEIKTLVEKWKKDVEDTYNQDFDLVAKHFFSSTHFIKNAEKYNPELLEEIRGISDGSGIDYNTIFAFQMSEEIDALSDALKATRCTSISINKTDSTPTILAQNMDPPLLFHGTPVLLHITDDANNEKFIFTFPGFIGLCGLNSNGVGVTCNGISMLNHSSDGLPVSFILRNLLDQKDEQSAHECLKEMPVGVPQCFTIGGRLTARCFECSANSKNLFYPFDNKNITLHTNFSISNRDFNTEYIELLKEYGKTVDSPYFCPRYFEAYHKIVEFNYDLNVQNIKGILSSTESDIYTISNENTFGCLIMELSESPVLHIAPGRPDSTEFITLRFNNPAAAASL